MTDFLLFSFRVWQGVKNWTLGLRRYIVLLLMLMLMLLSLTER